MRPDLVSKTGGFRKAETEEEAMSILVDTLEATEEVFTSKRVSGPCQQVDGRNGVSLVQGYDPVMDVQGRYEQGRQVAWRPLGTK